ncbi:MAG: 2-dehydropantoate 2-reductase [Anaerolineales bacterium]|jgi:2-dehydropantoate 2-reductase
MRIAVFGTGAVGGYFGGRLALSGQELVFIARGDHLRALQTQGLRVESLAGDFIVNPVQATDDPSRVGVVDAVLVGVKAWQVPEAALAMRFLVGEGTCVVPLQNGVDAPTQIAAVLGKQAVLGGLCRIASHLAAPGYIRHTGIEPYIAFGELNNQLSERVLRLKAAIEQAGVRVDVPDNIQAAMWEKFIFIASISGIGAITGAPVGIFRQLPETRQVLKQVLQEIAAVSRGHKVSLEEAVADRILAMIDGMPAGTMASMQRDILEGRPSELGSQTGAVVRLGLESGVATPTNAMIYASLLPKELRARGELNY